MAAKYSDVLAWHQANGGDAAAAQADWAKNYGLSGVRPTTASYANAKYNPGLLGTGQNTRANMALQELERKGVDIGAQDVSFRDVLAYYRGQEDPNAEASAYADYAKRLGVSPKTAVALFRPEMEKNPVYHNPMTTAGTNDPGAASNLAYAQDMQQQGFYDSQYQQFRAQNPQAAALWDQPGAMAAAQNLRHPDQATRIAAFDQLKGMGINPHGVTGTSRPPYMYLDSHTFDDGYTSGKFPTTPGPGSGPTPPGGNAFTQGPPIPTSPYAPQPNQPGPPVPGQPGAPQAPQPNQYRPPVPGDYDQNTLPYTPQPGGTPQMPGGMPFMTTPLFGGYEPSFFNQSPQFGQQWGAQGRGPGGGLTDSGMPPNSPLISAWLESQR